ncbi:uncharacterized protein CLUP02_16971, partial [Colletotrichum lupini]
SIFSSVIHSGRHSGLRYSNRRRRLEGTCRTFLKERARLTLIISRLI